MPTDDIPTTRAEELQDRMEGVNAEDRAELARGHGMPADTDRDAEDVPLRRDGAGRTEQLRATRGPKGRTAREVAYLARHREAMDNDELERFLAGESQFHDDLDEADGFTPFTDREETFLLQHHADEVDVLAGELERDPAQVRAKMQLMGLEDV